MPRVKQAQAWQKRAELAVREGRDDLAMQALGRQQEHTQRAGALEQTWRAQKEETEKLKASLRTLNDKIEEAKRKRNLLIAKQKRAQAQKRIHATMSGLSDQSAFEAFNRMASKIEEEERRSLAQAEVTEALTGDSLEDEFLRLESGSEDAGVDDRLLALKGEDGIASGRRARASAAAHRRGGVRGRRVRGRWGSRRFGRLILRLRRADPGSAAARGIRAAGPKRWIVTWTSSI